MKDNNSKFKRLMNHIFIDGLSGMALGLFATLIVGTILQQIASLIGDNLVGNNLYVIGKVAASLTGAGIGCGVAYKFKSSPLVLLSAATSGMVGAFAGKILAGTLFLAPTTVQYIGPGEPLSAFIASLAAIEIGTLVSGKTKVDILITPLVSITSGSVFGLILGPPIAEFINWLGSIINWATECQPFIMGVIISVLMGIFLTLPISSAAIGIALGLEGIAAGAAVVGCCCNMVGFAVASYRENKFGGLLAQGLGTSMLQMPNIVRKPIIWLPAIISSAILGPISTCLFAMENNATGAGMGTSGLVGQLMAFEVMVPSLGIWVTLLQILLMHFILPAAISLAASEIMRKAGLIKPGDMKLDV